MQTQSAAERRVILATGNPGKVREMHGSLQTLGLRVSSASEFDMPDAIESGLTFVENAIIKARHASEYSGLPSIADDSGLEVDALGGAPGIYSARYAGEGCSDAENNRKLLIELGDVPRDSRTARFQCVIVYLKHPEDSTPLICCGSWEGKILTAERGDAGFGYDPLFYVPSHGCSSAELPPAVKTRISHRAQALDCLLETLRNHGTFPDTSPPP